ncbi:MAG: hypothetical protein U0V48_15085 [Anaerolineales bacterium]
MLSWHNESNLFDFHELRKGFSLPVTWNSGRQGDGTPSLALSELMGWWERQGRRMNDEG